MKKHVLLIDDDKNELTIFMEALNSINGSFKCTYAESPEQALEMLKYLHPDFIFVDYNPPNVEGLQMLSVIRNEAAWQRTKVFIYTETVSDEIVKMAQVLGAAGCIEKKTSVRWLTHLLKAIFDGQLMPGYAILKNPLQV